MLSLLIPHCTAAVLVDTIGVHILSNVCTDIDLSSCLPDCHLQSNHRSWADFYLDVVATEGNAQMLSRMAVALVFPMFMGAVCVIRSVILFQRRKNHDKEVCPG